MPVKDFLMLFEADFFVIYNRMGDNKKRIIKSLDTLPDNLKDLVKRQYPNGFETNISRIMNAKKEPIFVFPLETEDSVYLVKVPATKNSSGGYDVDSGEREEFDGEDGGDFDSDGYSGKSGEFDDDGEDSSKDPSYEPDFDN
ncbi:MAG: hypothetical protein RIA63_09360 [Cyclobacteriaceae bacterium]